MLVIDKYFCYNRNTEKEFLPLAPLHGCFFLDYIISFPAADFYPPSLFLLKLLRCRFERLCCRICEFLWLLLRMDMIFSKSF